MSNFLAPATVTATLMQVVQTAISVVAGATVTTGRPDPSADGAAPAAVNIFLFGISPNPALRNDDTPTRDPGGALTRRPQAALDLHYLLTFLGDDARLEPQRLLGTTVAALHARPMLTRQAIADVIAAAGAVGPGDPRFYLGASDLDRQVETVKFTPLALSLEELSRLWSVFFQTQYALSLAYQASVVLIEGDQSPRTALPVLRRGVHAIPTMGPQIDEVEPQVIAAAPGAKLTVRGRDLQSSSVTVRIEDIPVPPDPGGSQDQLEVTLPASLESGVNRVQVLHGVDLGDSTSRSLLASNVAAFVLAPSIANATFVAAADPRISVDAEPDTGVKQLALLLLTEFATPVPEQPRGLTIEARKRAAPGDPLVFGAAGIPAATYLVRVRIDGANSPLTLDEDETSPTFRRFIGPTVMVT